MTSNNFLALQAFAMVMGHNPGAFLPSSPVSDWKHNEERLRRAEEKRARKALKRRNLLNSKSNQTTRKEAP